MFRKVLLILLVTYLAQNVFRFVYQLGFFQRVYNHSPGPCRTINMPDCSEDILLFPSGRVLISSGVLAGFDASLTGDVFLFDLNTPGDDPVPLHPGGIDEKSFAPTGLSYWYDKDRDVYRVFVLNLHKGLESWQVDIFEFDDKKTTRILKHISSVRDATYGLLNNIAATGPDSFYATHMFSSHYMALQIIEAFLFWPGANVLYCEGSGGCRVVQDGLRITNGIALSRDSRYVYVAEYLQGDVQVYERRTDNTLMQRNTIELGCMVDNINVDLKTGNLWIGAMPKLSNPLPARVLVVEMLNQTDSSRVVELYENDGHEISGSSVATFYQDKLLIGSFLHRPLLCQMSGTNF